MIEPTDEMRRVVKSRMGIPDGVELDPWMEAAIGDVLAIVERDYDVQRRTSHGWPARVWPLNRGALHPHYCVSCSDGHAKGDGCINCRQTGYDQTPWPTCEGCKP